MKDFIKTIEFVTRFNNMVGDVERCVFADQRTNSYLIEQMYMEHGDNAVNMPAKTMGDWEREQFEESTTKLESKLGELRGELLDLCPSIDDMPQYYQVWERILLGMNSPEKAWWDERMSESFWQEKGVCDGCTQVACTMAVIGLQCLQNAVQSMISDVKRIYVIEAAGETIADDVVQHTTDDVLGDFRAKYAFIKDIDNFLRDVKIMDGKTLADYYKKNIKQKGIDLKHFVDDVMRITTDRAGQKGWNYEAIKKHPF